MTRRESPQRAWLQLRIDPESLKQIRRFAPGRWVLESIEGVVSVALSNWKLSSLEYAQRINGELKIPHVVLIEVVDGLLDAAQGLKQGHRNEQWIHLAGTPLELRLLPRGTTIEISLVEFVNYTERSRTIGGHSTTASELRKLASKLAQSYLRQILRANPALGDDVPVKNLRAAAGAASGSDPIMSRLRLS